MRVGQLARKLAISPSEIISFLNQKEISLEEGSNAKLNTDLEKEIVGHFAPDLLASFEAEVSTYENHVAPIESIADDASQTTEDSHKASSENMDLTEAPRTELIDIQEIVQPEVIFNPNTDETAFEVIKAPKQELPGLKVVGKIDLPEPKKKEADAQEDTAVESSEMEDIQSETVSGENEQGKRRSRGKERERFRGKRDRREYPQKNSIVVQREREAREAEKRKKREEKQNKEKRTQNYLKKVNAYSPTKSFRLYREEDEHKQEPVKPIKRTPARKKAKPTTVWDKFVSWLKREQFN